MVYRLCVGAVIVNKEGEIFLAQRLDNKAAWQLPQGGIDDGESPKDAIIRELNEEIGVKNVYIIKELEDWLTYDLPEYLRIKIEKFWGKGIIGQKQKWFLCSVDEENINLNTPHPEFSDYKWASIEEVMDSCVDFKKDVYAAVLKTFF